MKTIRNISAVIFVSILLLTGCETYLDVYSNYDKTANFNNYRTYSWLADKDSSNTIYNNQIVRNNLRNYINTALANRNFKQVASNPDIYLDMVVINGIKHHPPGPVYWYPPVGYTYYYYNGYYPYYSTFPNLYYSPYYPSYSYYYPYGYGYSTAYYYDDDPEGSVTLTMVDRKAARTVWTATAQGNIYDPSYNDNLSTAVADIMETYPVSTPTPSPSGQ